MSYSRLPTWRDRMPKFAGFAATGPDAKTQGLMRAIPFETQNTENLKPAHKEVCALQAKIEMSDQRLEERILDLIGKRLLQA